MTCSSRRLFKEVDLWLCKDKTRLAVPQKEASTAPTIITALLYCFCAVFSSTTAWKKKKGVKGAVQN